MDNNNPQVPYPYLCQLLFLSRDVDMQSTADQSFRKCYAGDSYVIDRIFAKCGSGGASVTCLGGIYDGAGKSGNTLVSALQSWVTLASNVIVTPTLAALVGAKVLSNTPIVSLSTGSLAACTADFFIWGYDISWT